MTTNIEIEFKQLLTKDEFEKLLHTFQIQQNDFFIQTNYYFETDEFALKNFQSSLRLRKREKGFELTFKRQLPKGALEINQMLNEYQAQKLLQSNEIPDGKIKQELIHLGVDIQALQLFGNLETRRAELPYKDGLLVFDHSMYLQKEDFELEYETNHWERGQKVFLELLQTFNIKRKEADTKIGRLYKEMMKRRND